MLHGCIGPDTDLFSQEGQTWPDEELAEVQHSRVLHHPRFPFAIRAAR